MPENRVKGPAIAVIVGAAFGCLNGMAGIALNALGTALTLPGGQEAIPGMVSGALGVVIGVVQLGVGAFVIFAMTRMMRLEDHGIAMAGAILSLIPFLHGCCCLGIPFGIWALVVLCDAEVKAAFQSGGANQMPSP